MSRQMYMDVESGQLFPVSDEPVREKKTNADSFRVEEAYNWRDDIMEITHRIIYETDEARLNNIAEHFEVDLSEIREFLEMKRKKMQKPQTNADRIRSMTDDEIAHTLWLTAKGGIIGQRSETEWLTWLKREATDGQS